MIKDIKKKYHYFIFYFSTKKLRKNFPFYRVESIKQTINDIIKNKKNISRFGDGEFRLVLDTSDISFQDGSQKLTEMLREVLQSKLQNHIIALPETFSKKNGLNQRVKYWWLNYINNIGVLILHFLDPKRKYGNAFITRFYLDYENQKKVPSIIENLKKIWENKDILIVEGRFSRLGVGNDLFNGAASIQRILCPERDAFVKYNEIISEIKKQSKEKLVLIALGPTATVMAYELAKENIWALDIGHVDLEYMWYLQNAKEKSPVIGRLVNETDKQLSLDIPLEYREKYYNSIVAEIN